VLTNNAWEPTSATPGSLTQCATEPGLLLKEETPNWVRVAVVGVAESSRTIVATIAKVVSRRAHAADLGRVSIRN
jgi:hypothetical protein